MSATSIPRSCDLSALRVQVRELTDVRRDLAAHVEQPQSSWLPTIGGAAVVGGIGAAIGASMRTFGGAHGGPATNIGVGLLGGGAIGALIGTVIATSMVDTIDPATANPDIGILDARIAALNTQIVDCAVEGS